MYLKRKLSDFLKFTSFLTFLNCLADYFKRLIQLSNPPILINALCNLFSLIIIANCSHAFFLTGFSTFLNRRNCSQNFFYVFFQMLPEILNHYAHKKLLFFLI
jgi:hypothetical protein